MTHRRSYSWASSGGAFAYVESSDDPLPPLTVPGIGQQAGRQGLSEADREAVVEQTRRAQIERDGWAAGAGAQLEQDRQAMQEAGRDNRAAEIAALQHRPLRREIGR